MTSELKLIINADDWGFSDSFNRGIVFLAEKGLVTSTSVMIHEKFVEKEKLDHLRKLGISVGLHLDIEGEDWRGDIERQVIDFKDMFGTLPSHLDGHQHCHLWRKRRPEVLDLAQKYGLPVRSVGDVGRLDMRTRNIKTPDNYIDWHPRKTDNLLDAMEKIESGITEMVCHPGYHDPDCDYPYNRQREEELNFMNSQRFTEAIKKFELINYYEFRDSNNK